MWPFTNSIDTDKLFLLVVTAGILISTCRSGTFPASGRRLQSLNSATPIPLRSQLPADAAGHKRMVLSDALTDVTPAGLNVGSLCPSTNPAMWASLSDVSYGEVVADSAVCLNHPTPLVRAPVGDGDIT